MKVLISVKKKISEILTIAMLALNFGVAISQEQNVFPMEYV